jgi:hypothetical protein
LVSEVTCAPVPILHRGASALSALAIHIVWTTYGTWLPGDARGHWSPLFDFSGRLLETGGRFGLPDESTRRVAGSSLEAPKVLSPADLAVVADRIREQVSCPTGSCPPGPRCFAAALEPTHVHLLLGPKQEKFSRCVGRLTGTSSSAVLKVPGNEGRSLDWTEDYWKVFLFNAVALETVKHSIDEQNRRRGLPAEPSEWISPLEL